MLVIYFINKKKNGENIIQKICFYSLCPRSSRLPQLWVFFSLNQSGRHFVSLCLIIFITFSSTKIWTNPVKKTANQIGLYIVYTSSGNKYCIQMNMDSGRMTRKSYYHYANLYINACYAMLYYKYMYYMWQCDMHLIRSNGTLSMVDNQPHIELLWNVQTCHGKNWTNHE